MGLNNENEEVISLQKKLSLMRNQFTITEQENIRLKLLNQDQESIIRSNLDKIEQTRLELVALETRKDSLEEKVNLLQEEEKAASIKLEAARKAHIDIVDSEKKLIAHVDELTAESKRVTKEIAEKRADFEARMSSMSIADSARRTKLERAEADFTAKVSKLVEVIKTF